MIPIQDETAEQVDQKRGQEKIQGQMQQCRSIPNHLMQLGKRFF